jgi:CBS domain-containing protein
MSTESAVSTVTYAASGTLATKQYFLVKRHTTAGQCVLVSGINDIPIGVLQNAPDAAGKAAEIVALGRTKAQVAAATDINVGDLLGPDANGRLVAIATDNALVCAVAEEAATSATGDIISVTMIAPRWVHA